MNLKADTIEWQDLNSIMSEIHGIQIVVEVDVRV